MYSTKWEVCTLPKQPLFYNTDTQFQTRNIGIVVVIFTTYLGKLIFIPYTPLTVCGFRNPLVTVASWRPLWLT